MQFLVVLVSWYISNVGLVFVRIFCSPVQQHKGELDEYQIFCFESEIKLHYSTAYFIP